MAEARVADEQPVAASGLTREERPTTARPAEAAAPAAASPARRWILLVLAVGLALVTYNLIADRLTPYTSEATVQAYLVHIGAGGGR